MTLLQTAVVIAGAALGVASLAFAAPIERYVQSLAVDEFQRKISRPGHTKLAYRLIGLVLLAGTAGLHFFL
jgi:hypothetical protein